MAVSRLRCRWGSRWLIPFAGLTVLAMTAGAGSGVAASGPAGPFSHATIAAASVSAPQSLRGVPLTDNGVAGRSAAPGSADAVTTANRHSRGDVAPFGVLIEHLAVGASPQRTRAHDDARPPLGGSGAPRGPRAPPLHLA